MSPPRGYRIEWSGPLGLLGAVEPTLDEIAACAPDLAAAFNDPHNAAMMGHDEPFSEEEVVAHYADLIDEGARPFLLQHDGIFAGDADLRAIEDGRAELALMIAARAAQGRGLGTRFAVMVHAFGFRVLGLERIFVAIGPRNPASRRVFEKVGHRLDDSPEARAYAEADDEITMSIGAAELERAHDWLDEIRIAPRGR